MRRPGFLNGDLREMAGEILELVLVEGGIDTLQQARDRLATAGLRGIDAAQHLKAPWIRPIVAQGMVDLARELHQKRSQMRPNWRFKVTLGPPDDE